MATSKLLLLSDFNCDLLSNSLRKLDGEPMCELITTDYGGFIQPLIDAQHELWASSPDYAFVWTRPQGAVSGFQKLLHNESVSAMDLLDETDAFSALLLEASSRVKTLFVASWVLPDYVRAQGMTSFRHDEGVDNLLMQMNLRLSRNCSEAKNIFLLNSERWVRKAGKYACNPKLWYLGRIAFGTGVLDEAARDLKSAMRSLMGATRKLIVVDLDDTLWGGVVGDTGWENLNLGGHDPFGESFVDFQKTLKSLTRKGVILGVVSKNDEAVALAAIRNHPEMVLREDDFAGWRINWEDKAANIISLTGELNLGLESVVFLDDNPAERARVSEALPEVLVPNLPEDKMLCPSFIQNLDCFDRPFDTVEDETRSRMYAEEKKRTAERGVSTSLEEWLAGLQIRVRIEELKATNLPRTVQLFNKTNQMNLSTRRLTENELSQWAAKAQHKIWTCRVSDKYGDYGLTGVVSLRLNGEAADIVDFLLSCRVMGRRVEEALIAVAVRYATESGLSKVCARFIPTERNKPCFEFWMRSGFEYDEAQQLFSLSTLQPYNSPLLVEVETR